jgi:hypothetical protein
MLEDSFDLLGLKQVNLTHTLHLMLEYNKSVVTKLMDAILITHQIQMVEILDPQTEALDLAKRLSPFQLILLMGSGLFNGHGSEELSLLEIITLV